MKPQMTFVLGLAILMTEPASAETRFGCPINPEQYAQARSMAEQAAQYGRELLENPQKRVSAHLHQRLCDLGKRSIEHAIQYGLRETIAIDNLRECSSLLGRVETYAKVMGTRRVHTPGENITGLILNADRDKMSQHETARIYIEGFCGRN